jgi:hypothetical protein
MGNDFFCVEAIFTMRAPLADGKEITFAADI